jgi:ribosomal protein S18 acetylase RimI-like enzyme
MLQHVGKSALWVDFFVGEALMRELIDWAKRTPRVRKIELLVRATNQGAVRLYSKFGFFEEVVSKIVYVCPMANSSMT